MWSQRWGIVDVGRGCAHRDVAQVNAVLDKDGRRNAINDAGALSNNAISTTAVVVVVNTECGPPCGTKNRNGSGVQVCRHACEARRLVLIGHIERTRRKTKHADSVDEDDSCPYNKGTTQKCKVERVTFRVSRCEA